MRRYNLTFLLLLLPHALTAEGFLGAGSYLNVSSVSEPPATPAGYVSAGYDYFHPFDSAWSLFSDGGGTGVFYPLSSDIKGRAYAAGDISYRGELFFSRFEAGSYAEYSSWQENPYWRSYAELYLSLDFSRMSVFADPAFVWEIEEGFSGIGGEGSLGISAGLGSVIVSPKIHGGIMTAPAGGYETTWGALVKLDWYPGIPFAASAVLGASRIDSPLGGETVGFLESGGSAFLSSRLDLSVGFDGSVTVMDDNFIGEDGLAGDRREYRVYGKPEAGLTFSISPKMDVDLTLGAEFLRSNSSYLNMLLGSADLSVTLIF
jgi:hypothetical protein